MNDFQQSIIFPYVIKFIVNSQVDVVLIMQLLHNWAVKGYFLRKKEHIKTSEVQSTLIVEYLRLY